MIVSRTVEGVRRLVGEARARGQRIGFVPTMGFLHEGHLSLIDLARAGGAGTVVVSIFVNPLQFGPGEDFERYPRDEERDVKLLEERGADLLFMPDSEVLYPAGFSTRVSVGALSEVLEGERRPGHFDGVATVVLKLFNIVAPDLAVFGEKDAQQCAVVGKMVRELALPIELLFAPTARESDGLAMSSRNAYLSKEERRLAPALQSALQAGKSLIMNGTDDVSLIEERMRLSLESSPGVALDYLHLVDPSTFQPPSGFDRDLLLVGAVRVGKTRLIDNVRVPYRGAEG